MTTTPAPAARLYYLDATKGILVVLMVVYHSLNYTNQHQLAFRFLSFLPLTFILITGFLLPIVYAQRCHDAPAETRRRLLIRGFRLLLLFTLLNIVAQYVRSPAYGQSVGVEAFFERWIDVYAVGGTRIAVFEVLLPIAYLLLLAPWLIALCARHALYVPALAAVLAASGAVLDWNGDPQPNLNFMAAGLLGIWIGTAVPHGSYFGKVVWPALGAYAAYFPLGLLRGYVFLVQLTGAIVALFLINGLAVRFIGTDWWSRRLIRIGQYSLPAYIAQIAILQLFSRFLGRPDPLSLAFALLFGGTLILMTGLIESTALVRQKSKAADRIYRAIFA